MTVGSRISRCASSPCRWIEALLLASLQDCYADARACAALHLPLCRCNDWCLHNGWMTTTSLPKCGMETDMLSNRNRFGNHYKIKLLTPKLQNVHRLKSIPVVRTNLVLLLFPIQTWMDLEYVISRQLFQQISKLCYVLCLTLTSFLLARAHR